MPPRCAALLFVSQVPSCLNLSVQPDPTFITVNAPYAFSLSTTYAFITEKVRDKEKDKEKNKEKDKEREKEEKEKVKKEREKEHEADHQHWLPWLGWAKTQWHSPESRAERPIKIHAATVN